MMKDVQKLSPDLFQQANQNNVDNEVIARPSLTFWQDVRRRLFQHKGAMLGLVLLVIIALLAIFGPMVSKHSYKEQDLGRAKLPPKIPVIENVHWLPFDGTDQYGVDQYENVILKSTSGLVQMTLAVTYGQEHGKVHAYHYISLFSGSN